MKRVDIFTKMDMAGGSEFRAVEMANAISQVAGYQSILIPENSLPEKLRVMIGPTVELHEGVFSKPDFEMLYSLDHLLVINTDSRDFTTAAYWSGKSESHSWKVDLSRIRQMVFLFNFIVSPSCSLPTLKQYVSDIRIIAANGKFFREISEQDRYEAVRHYPRVQLESPINPNVVRQKSSSDRLRIGMHSLPAPGKWNEQFPELIQHLNKRHKDRILWDFMGMPRKLRSRISAGNVVFRQEFSTAVSDFLSGVDVFLFFLSWKREEPWARSAGEALMTGCPVISTPKGGNKNQIVHGNTGFLCKTLAEFEDACTKLIENPELLRTMGDNAKRAARRFTSIAVVERFLEFIE
jgi:hypothetical protein